MHMYHLIQISAGDKWKTAFQTYYGSFEWLVMPEGPTNAPTAFQQFMIDIFMDMMVIIVIIYLDDILIYSNNIPEHKAHMSRKNSTDPMLMKILPMQMNVSSTSLPASTSDTCCHL